MSVIYTPGGVLNTERVQVDWPPAFMRMLALFAANAEDIQLGIHCARCKESLQGQNAREDTEWRMECACRTYRGRNPLPKPTSSKPS